MRKLKILFALAGNESKASSRVRGYWIAEELERLGHTCTLSPQLQRKDFFCLAIDILKHDVLILQKTYGRYHYWLQSFARKLGKLTFVDIDDTPSITNAERTMRRVAGMMRQANGVFAGSTHLKDYADEHKKNTYLVPSSIRLENYHVANLKENKTETPVCLGWIGNGNYYANDLINLLTQPVEQIASRQPIHLKIVGACGVKELHENFAKIPNLTLECIDSINWSDPIVVQSHIQSFDIGLYPLIENRFNRYKCGFKALEYMACGLPVVSSRIAVNSEIVRHKKTGYLADSSEDWTLYLEALIASQELRTRMGEEGRKIIEDSYSTKNTALLILDHIQNSL